MSKPSVLYEEMKLRVCHYGVCRLGVGVQESSQVLAFALVDDWDHAAYDTTTSFGFMRHTATDELSAQRNRSP